MPVYWELFSGFGRFRCPCALFRAYTGASLLRLL